MKKIALLFAMALALNSCEEEVSTNSPAFQASINYDNWRASTYTATVSENGKLIITGNDDIHTVKITIPNYALGQYYELGKNTTYTVEYTKVIDGVPVVYKTGANIGRGFISLESDETNEPNTITGKFLAETKNNTLPANSTIPKVMTLSNGVFYKIPITKEVATP